MSNKYKEKSKELARILKPINNDIRLEEEYKIKVKKFINNLKIDIEERKRSQTEFETKQAKDHPEFSIKSLASCTIDEVNTHEMQLELPYGTFDMDNYDNEFRKLFYDVLEFLYHKNV